MGTQIDDWIARIDHYSHEFEGSFRGLDQKTLNTKPSPEEWSIAQCLDHLIRTNEKYFPIFKALANGSHRNRTWAKFPGVSGMFGNMLKKAVSEEINRKSKTFPPFEPSQSELPANILDRFLAQQETLKSAFLQLKNVDLKANKITSPVSKVVVYSAEDACEIVVSHEGRHLNQARNVLSRINSAG